MPVARQKNSVGPYNLLFRVLSSVGRPTPACATVRGYTKGRVVCMSQYDDFLRDLKTAPEDRVSHTRNEIIRISRTAKMHFIGMFELDNIFIPVFSADTLTREHITSIAEIQAEKVETEAQLKRIYGKSWDRQRRVLRIKANGGRHTTEEWIELCAKYDNKCVACRKEKRLTRDHVIPVSKGGSNHISNIQPLCHQCNARKHTSSIDYRY